MTNLKNELNNRDKKEAGINVTDLIKKIVGNKDSHGLESVEAEEKKDVVNGGKNISQYMDTTGELSSKNLKLYLWLSKHKVFFYRFSVVLLIVFSIFSLAYSIVKISDYAIFGYTEDQILYQGIASTYDYTGVHPRYAPQSLQILETKVLNSGNDRYDLVAVMYNSNEWFKVEFDYYFIISGEKTRTEHAVFMPSESRPIGILGIESEGGIGSNNFVLENVVWKRISRHEVDDIKFWMEERLQFKVEDVKFLRSGGAAKIKSHIIKFNITNDGAFSYKLPMFQVGLYQGNTLVGLMPVQLDDFYTLETKEIDLRSVVKSLVVTEIELYPIIDLFDSQVYTQK